MNKVTNTGVWWPKAHSAAFADKNERKDHSDRQCGSDALATSEVGTKPPLVGTATFLEPAPAVERRRFASGHLAAFSSRFVAPHLSSIGAGTWPLAAAPSGSDLLAGCSDPGCCSGLSSRDLDDVPFVGADLSADGHVGPHVQPVVGVFDDLASNPAFTRRSSACCASWYEQGFGRSSTTTRPRRTTGTTRTMTTATSANPNPPSKRTVASDIAAS